MENPLSSSLSPKTLAIISSSLLSSFLPIITESSSTSSLNSIFLFLLHLLRRLFLLIFSILLHFIPSKRYAVSPHVDSAVTTPSSRALFRLLHAVASIPASSRKYNVILRLTEQLLDGNITSNYSNLNQEPLSFAFSDTIRCLEEAMRAPANGKVRKWVEDLLIGKGGGEVASVEMEKMAAEVAWLAEKLDECGALDEAVKLWGGAKGLGMAALEADARVQASFVRVSALLLKHANSKQFGEMEPPVNESESENGSNIRSKCRMMMLTSWLPLLCRAPNGTDSPVLSSMERAEMVRVLEEMIEKLRWEEQDEVLALWLHHFATNPDSDWPNLEACYARWYTRTRDLSLK